MSAAGGPDQPQPEGPPDRDAPWWTGGGGPQPFLASRRRRRFVLLLIGVALAVFVAFFLYVAVTAAGMGGMSM